MSQRVSGFKRLPSESYDTIEPWPVRALLAHLPIRSAWDPCEGSGSLLAALQRYGVEAIGSGHDFFTIRQPPVEVDAIVMNPPYGEQRRGEAAMHFLEHALTLPVQYIAALLPIDFDSAIGRQNLFRQCPSFIGKIVLLGRLRWIPDSTGSPSTNHCWLLWDHANVEAPTIRYASEHDRDGAP
jgi:hypothetical protein